MEVFRGVGVDLSRLPARYRMWWRSVTIPTPEIPGEDLDPQEARREAVAMWAGVRAQMDDALLAAELLSPWLAQVRGTTTDEESV
jgi:hypothetical protein